MDVVLELLVVDPFEPEDVVPELLLALAVEPLLLDADALLLEPFEVAPPLDEGVPLEEETEPPLTLALLHPASNATTSPAMSCRMRALL